MSLFLRWPVLNWEVILVHFVLYLVIEREKHQDPRKAISSPRFNTSDSLKCLCYWRSLLWCKGKTSFNDKKQRLFQLDNGKPSHAGCVVRKYIGNSVSDNCTVSFCLVQFIFEGFNVKLSSWLCIKHLMECEVFIKVQKTSWLGRKVEDRLCPVLGCDVPPCLTEVTRSLYCCLFFVLLAKRKCLVVMKLTTLQHPCWHKHCISKHSEPSICGCRWSVWSYHNQMGILI